MKKKKILVVDDAAISREIIKNCLEEEYDILVAENGDVALDILKEKKYEIAMILLDLQMPRMNGIHFLEKRQKNDNLKKIPVIVVTAYDDIENEVKALEAGADDVLLKPFDRRILHKRVSNLIEMFGIRIRNEENENLQDEKKIDILNNQVQNVVDYLSDGVLVFELSGQQKHFFVNDALCKPLGYTKLEYSELVKENTYALVHPDDLEELIKKINEAEKNHGELECTFRLKKSNNKYQWLTLKASVMEDIQNSSIFCGVFTEVDQLKNQFEKDSLTGLCNREAFEQIVNIFFKGNSKETNNSRMAALFMIDVDNFKSINDHFGHIYGDHVLIEIGEKIHSIFRDEDITAHVGGDEFCVFLTHKIPEEIIDLRARQICEAIKTEYRVAGEVVSTSCSVGVAIAPQHGNSYTQLYKNADKAQYLAKKAGKNKHIIFKSSSE